MTLLLLLALLNVMLCVVMQDVALYINIVRVSVTMLNVIRINVVAPFFSQLQSSHPNLIKLLFLLYLCTIDLAVIAPQRQTVQLISTRVNDEEKSFYLFLNLESKTDSLLAIMIDTRKDFNILYYIHTCIHLYLYLLCGQVCVYVSYDVRSFVCMYVCMFASIMYACFHVL